MRSWLWNNSGVPGYTIAPRHPENGSPVQWAKLIRYADGTDVREIQRRMKAYKDIEVHVRSLRPGLNYFSVTVFKP